MLQLKILFLAMILVVILSEKILQKVYDQNKTFYIYVYDQPSFSAQSIFMEFCHSEKRQCAFLDESTNGYERLLEFIGYKSKEYFLIIDGRQTKKYVLEAKNVAKIHDLQMFQQEFLQKKWRPFYASQHPKNDRYMPCRSIAGSQVKNYLEQTGMKVLYLYSNQKKCHICGQMLRYYADTAQNFYSKDFMHFAYINVDFNDHPLIETKKTPLFLLFERDNKLSAIYTSQNYNELQKKIQQLIQRQTGEIKSLTRHQYTKFLTDVEDI